METQIINATILAKRPLLKRFATKFTKDPFEIEDLVQETFIRSLKTIERLRLDPKLMTWLFVIMKNVYINKYRKQQRFKIVEKELITRDGHCVTRNSATSNFVINDIHNSIKKLCANHYACFTMFIDGYKYHEIAEQLCIPEGTVKTRIYLARKFLKKELGIYRDEV